MSPYPLQDMDHKRERLLRDGYVILPQVVPAERLGRLRSDIETVVQRQRASDPTWETNPQPRGFIADQVDSGTVGALEFLMHDHTHGVSAGLLDCPRGDRLHPPEKGRLICLILLSKLVLDLHQRSRGVAGDAPGRDSGQPVYQWQLQLLVERFSSEELEGLHQRFGPVDDALKGREPRHVSGFLGPRTDYEFEEVPAEMTVESVGGAILVHSPGALEGQRA
jgi:hypothetical protein